MIDDELHTAFDRAGKVLLVIAAGVGLAAVLLMGDGRRADGTPVERSASLRVASGLVLAVSGLWAALR